MAAIRMGMRVNNFLFGFIILLVVGGLFVLIGYLFLTNNLDIIKNGTLTKATVIELAEHHSKKSTTYYPVVEYLTSAGELIRVESSTGCTKNAYKAGDLVNIIYNRSDPKNFIFDKFVDKYGFPLIFIFAGGMCLLINIFQVARKINAWRLTR